MYDVDLEEQEYLIQDKRSARTSCCLISTGVISFFCGILYIYYCYLVMTDERDSSWHFFHKDD